MLCNVGCSRCHDGGFRRCSRYQFLEFGVFRHSHVSRDVCLMVLVHERFDWFPSQNPHVFSNWVSRLLVILSRNNFPNVFHPQHIKHLTVKLGQIINLRRTLR